MIHYEAMRGSAGDSHDNTLAETINGSCKAKIIHERGPWRNFQAVEMAALEWMDWFNNRRLLEPIGNISTAGEEAACYANLAVSATVGRLKQSSLRETRSDSPGAVHCRGA